MNDECMTKARTLVIGDIHGGLRAVVGLARARHGGGGLMNVRHASGLRALLDRLLPAAVALLLVLWFRWLSMGAGFLFRRPQEVIQQMTKELQKAMQTPAIKEAWERNGSDVPDVTGPGTAPSGRSRRRTARSRPTGTWPASGSTAIARSSTASGEPTSCCVWTGARSASRPCVASGGSRRSRRPRR